MPAGRPTKYQPAYPKTAAKLCKLGATDIEMADFFGVTVSTLNLWKQTHPEFSASIKVAKEAADTRVERSLYERATGYSFDSVKILTVSLGNNSGSEVQQVPYREHVPPDATSMIFWLKNRQPTKWRDRIEHTGADGKPMAVAIVRYADDPASK